MGAEEQPPWLPIRSPLSFVSVLEMTLIPTTTLTTTTVSMLRA
jgi:hypothetical protein